MIKEFELTVRTIILKKDKILICEAKDKNYYFFPGGHINYGESIKGALFREIKEELGLSIKSYNFIGVVENIYTEEQQKHHEINLVFEVELYQKEIKGREDHLVFVFKKSKELEKVRVLPVALKKALMKWLRDGEIFWASQIYKKYYYEKSSHCKS